METLEPRRMLMANTVVWTGQGNSPNFWNEENWYDQTLQEQRVPDHDDNIVFGSAGSPIVDVKDGVSLGAVTVQQGTVRFVGDHGEGGNEGNVIVNSLEVAGGCRLEVTGVLTLEGEGNLARGASLTARQIVLWSEAELRSEADALTTTLLVLSQTATMTLVDGTAHLDQLKLSTAYPTTYIPVLNIQGGKLEAEKATVEGGVVYVNGSAEGPAGGSATWNVRQLEGEGCSLFVYDGGDLWIQQKMTLQGGRDDVLKVYPTANVHVGSVQASGFGMATLAVGEGGDARFLGTSIQGDVIVAAGKLTLDDLYGNPVTVEGDLRVLEGGTLIVDAGVDRDKAHRIAGNYVQMEDGILKFDMSSYDYDSSWETIEHYDDPVLASSFQPYLVVGQKVTLAGTVDIIYRDDYFRDVDSELRSKGLSAIHHPHCLPYDMTRELMGYETIEGRFTEFAGAVLRFLDSATGQVTDSRDRFLGLDYEKDYLALMSLETPRLVQLDAQGNWTDSLLSPDCTDAPFCKSRLTDPGRTAARNLLLVAPGSRASADGWPTELARAMARAMVNTYGSATDVVANWDVVILEWDEYNTGTGADWINQDWKPFTAATLGINIGESLAEWLQQVGRDNYQHVHVISHSAGVWLVDALADAIDARNKEQGTAEQRTLHLTLFDAFVPQGGITEYSAQIKLWDDSIYRWGETGSRVGQERRTIDDLGDTASYAEQFFDGRMVAGIYNQIPLGPHVVPIRYPALPMTDALLSRAVNFNVTALAPDLRYVLLRFPYDLPELLFNLETNYSPASQYATQSHSWPHQYYRCTVENVDQASPDPPPCRQLQADPFGAVLGMGAPYALEGTGQAVPTYQGKIQQGAVIDLATARLSALNPASHRVNLQSGGAASGVLLSPEDSVDVRLTTPGSGALRYTTTFDSPTPFEHLAFNYRFGTDIAAGYLALYVDGELAFGTTKDLMSLYGTGWLSTGTVALARSYEAGPHTLEFVVDPLDTGTPVMLDFADLEVGTRSAAVFGPHVASFSATPASVPESGSTRLTAVVVPPADGETKAVVFYREANGIPGLQPNNVLGCGDELVGVDDQRGDGWSALVSVQGLVTGEHEYYAVAVDDRQVRSEPVRTQVMVADGPPIIVSLTEQGVLHHSISHLNGPYDYEQYTIAQLQAHLLSNTEQADVGVTFYRETNGTRGLQPASDQPLGVDDDGTDGWTMTTPWVAVDELLAHDVTFYAIATDSRGRTSDVAMTELTGRGAFRLDVVPTAAEDAEEVMLVVVDEGAYWWHETDEYSWLEFNWTRAPLVAFYRESNGQDGLQADGDTLVGEATGQLADPWEAEQTMRIWTITESTSDWTPGEYTCYAVLQDQDYAYANVLSTRTRIGDPTPPRPPFQNPDPAPDGRYDVDDDQRVTPRDALLVINYLTRFGAGAIPAAAPTSLYIDVNGDGKCTPVDALLIINRLSRRDAGGEGEPADGLRATGFETAYASVFREPDAWTESRLDGASVVPGGEADRPPEAQSAQAFDGAIREWEASDVSGAADTVMAFLPNPLKYGWAHSARRDWALDLETTLDELASALRAET